MRHRSFIRRMALMLLSAACCVLFLGADPDSGKARIALFEPAGQKEDAALAAVLSTVASSVDLSLEVLQRWEVKRLPATDPEKDLQRVRAYCQENRIDQAILGSGSARSGGGYQFKLVVYDRRADAITITQQGASKGALDMFDVTDTLVGSLLDGLSGTHLLFGSLSVDSDPAGAVITVNGREVGAAPLVLRGMPVGTLEVVGRSEGREETKAEVVIADGETASSTLKLARSVGTLAVAIPGDAVAVVRSAEIGQKQFSGSGTATLPTGAYEVQASCPGLTAVSGRVVVTRNGDTKWLPWPKGYLEVRAEPGDALIVVDGQEVGAAPRVVEVEPGVLHRVELKKDKYASYSAEVSEGAGEKTAFTGKLTPLPGSIRVETSMPGAEVDLDDNSRKAVTPAVFDGVQPGRHIVRIAVTTANGRWYTAGDPIPVEVKPGEPTLISKMLAEAKARLAFTDAPPGSVLKIDHQPLELSQPLSVGAVVPAGSLDVEVDGPSSQEWTGSVNLQVGDEAKQSLLLLTCHLPRRTIRLDGTAGQWEGLLPVWIPDQQLAFPNQPGTRIARGFACHDDSFLYFRYEFSNGSPTPDLSREIREELDYTQIIYTDQGEITARVQFRRSAFGRSTATTLGVRNPISKTWQGLEDNVVKFQIGDGALETAVPLAGTLDRIMRSGGFMQAMIVVADVRSSDGNWKSGVYSGRQMISLDF